MIIKKLVTAYFLTGIANLFCAAGPSTPPVYVFNPVPGGYLYGSRPHTDGESKRIDVSLREFTAQQQQAAAAASSAPATVLQHMRRQAPR